MGICQLFENVRENYCICFKHTVVPFFPRAGSFSYKRCKSCSFFARGSEHMLKKEDTSCVPQKREQGVWRALDEQNGG
jgi:hypothetical protein